MNPKQCVALLLAVAVPLLVGAQSPYLKEMPKEGEVPFGKVVYVDDGKCGKGQVKEVTGGSRDKGIARKVRCIERPDAP